MGVPFDKFMDRFSAEERADIDAHADRLIAEEIQLLNCARRWARHRLSWRAS